MIYHLRRATRADCPEVLRLYREAAARPDSVWNENYPTQFEIDEDFAAGTLFVFCLGAEYDPALPSSVIGAISVVPQNEYDDFDCWSPSDGSHREIARITIARSCSGRGLAARMVGAMLGRLFASGVCAVRLSVAKLNPAAQATYRKLGFAFVGETTMYGNDYYLCEILKEDSGCTPIRYF